MEEASPLLTTRSWPHPPLFALDAPTILVTCRWPAGGARARRLRRTRVSSGVDEDRRDGRLVAGLRRGLGDRVLLVDDDPVRLRDDGENEIRRRSERCAPSRFEALTAASGGTSAIARCATSRTAAEGLVVTPYLPTELSGPAEVAIAAATSTPTRASDGRSARSRPRPDRGRGDEARDWGGGVVEPDGRHRLEVRQQAERQHRQRREREQWLEQRKQQERQQERRDVPQVGARRHRVPDARRVRHQRRDDAARRPAHRVQAAVEGADVPGEVRDHDVEREHGPGDTQHGQRRAEDPATVPDRVPDGDSGEHERNVLLRARRQKSEEHALDGSILVEEPHAVEEEGKGERDGVDVVERVPTGRPGARGTRSARHSPPAGRRCACGRARTRGARRRRAPPPAAW